MSTNETKVDVLAVMDELCMRFANLREMYGFGESELTPKANAARAAVAELIEAAKAFKADYELEVNDSDGESAIVDPGCIECTAGATPNALNSGLCGYHRTCAALARCGGAA